jgi:hypothetical protein
LLAGRRLREFFAADAFQSHPNLILYPSSSGSALDAPVIDEAGEQKTRVMPAWRG